jgi:hypothetical protein
MNNRRYGSGSFDHVFYFKPIFYEEFIAPRAERTAAGRVARLARPDLIRRSSLVRAEKK